MKVFLVYTEWNHSGDAGHFVIDVTSTKEKAFKTARKEMRQIERNYYKAKGLSYRAEDFNADDYACIMEGTDKVLSENWDEVFIEEREVRWFKDIELVKEASQFAVTMRDVYCHLFRSERKGECAENHFVQAVELIEKLTKL